LPNAGEGLEIINRPVRVGPYEATAAGNVLMQHHAAGRIASLAEGRTLIRRSFATRDFVPERSGEWKIARRRFVELMR
jgi:sugar (pentulose or hexulose) kinase